MDRAHGRAFFFQAEDGIRDRSPSRGLGDVYKRQLLRRVTGHDREGVLGVQTGPGRSKRVQKGCVQDRTIKVGKLPIFGGKIIDFFMNLQWESGLKSVRAWSEGAAFFATAREIGPFWRKKSKVEQTTFRRPQTRPL